MCGRYVLMASPRQLQETYRATLTMELSDHRAAYNVCPTHQMPVVMESADERTVRSCRWGLIPRWARSASDVPLMINARSETLAEKPSFREPFRTQRCVVPANGFYEWQTSSEGKLPWYITPRQEELMSIAGLYEIWNSGEESIVSYTIITTEATGEFRDLHHRIPAILSGPQIDLWLDPETSDPDQLQPLLHPTPAETLDIYRVSRRVNSPANQDPSLIDPEPDLFS